MLTNDALVLQDPKMFRMVQALYFVTPVIGGMWIMSQVRVRRCGMRQVERACCMLLLLRAKSCRQMKI